MTYCSSMEVVYVLCRRCKRKEIEDIKMKTLENVVTQQKIEVCRATLVVPKGGKQEIM